MRIVTITVTDEFGNVTNDPQKHTYQLDLKTEGIDGIEKAVITLKNQILPDLQKQLLEEEQKEFIKKKPDSLRCNGTVPVTIKTLSGPFIFKNQRFLENDYEQTSHTYLGLTNQFEDGYVCSGLKEFSTYYANRLSYKEVEELVERTTGEKQLSDQSIQNTVVDKALEVSEQIESEALAILEDDTLVFPEINQEFDIYDINTKEVMIFVDGIQVKKQSESRTSKKKTTEKSENEADEAAKRVNSHIVLTQKKEGGFEYITSAIDNKGEELLPLSDIVKSKIIQEYGNETEAVNVVAITDGAKDIRTMIMGVFGFLVLIILDWYHLCKKVRELMSMIALNKDEKNKHLEFLFNCLWHGRTEEVLEYLKNKVKAKNEKKLQELITYIEKHQEEIIDYDRRKKAGKEVGLKPEDDNTIDSQSSSQVVKKADSESETDSGVQDQLSSPIQAVKKVIGSGRVEKACDSTIGKRQKHKAMSWSKLGSHSLAILRVVELNNKWFDIWEPNLQHAANDSCEFVELVLAA